MQPEHVAQIRKLVEDSPLLNQDERQEWLSLVELMNDKQLLELEKILTSAVLAAPKPAIPPPAQSASSNAAPAHIAPPPPPVTGGGVPKPAAPAPALHLSHILNIPNASARPAVPPPAPRPSVPLPPEMEKIMEEKELPAGEEEKELPDKAAPAAAPAEPIIRIPEKPENPPPQPAPAPEPKPAVKPAGKEDVFTPGINNPKLILNAQLSRVAQNAAAKAVPKSAPAAPRPQPAENRAVRLASLDQIAKLTPKDWKRESAPAFVQSLRGLIKQFGYHDVMFSLEKSPLYKAYVDTGLTILKNQTDFAELAKQAPGFRDMYLMREDFESLADVLRQLPVG